MKRGSTWSYVIRVKDPETGTSKPKWVGGFATENDAKEARDDARVKARRGEYVDRNAVTVAEYMEEWINGHAIEIKPKTLRDYRLMIRLYIVPRIGGLRLQAIRPATLTKLYRDLHTSGGAKGKALSARTVRYVHTVMRKALRDAVEVEELLPSNPAERAKLPRTDTPEAGTIWTTAQLRAFLTHARPHRLYAFFHLAAYSGARRGELLNLRWRDVDFEGRQIRITGTTNVIDRRRVEGTTKNGRSRTVSLDGETVKVLQDHRERQEAEQLKAGEEWKNGQHYVFVTGFGEPVYPDTVSSLVRTFIAAYNAPKGGPKPAVPLPPARLHDLRHLHATTLLLAGVAVHVVAARLGHTDPAITLRVYAHVISEQMATAAEVFAEAINSPAA
ncbi:tyrosine-type recombinase/integrase [Spongiactinospora sp. TRM90649]|uniref:tyrosine-type recombinase/integrase n=1 Tax=Spongiactinospora sp. TRM90649 TaxID=3031114 RepID=UPI0023F8F70E|nr:tyrosine-type recombinase/integrase [Spongiactinospora sp. TRM90649]MDF5751701.1 tyrosine-type recombinase/integrase [Spongiactinospora sp. TRM90649]